MKKIIVANWKMNPESLSEARRIVLSLEHRMHLYSDKVEGIVCPPFVFLPPFTHYLHHLKRGAQNLFWQELGAFTGEISPTQLKNFGVEAVILGHSERRIYFDESDEMVRMKILASLKHKIKPIVCLGGALNAGKSDMKRVVAKQFNAVTKHFDKKQLEKIIFVYEPIWAISTMKNGEAATGEHAADLIQHIRAMLAKHLGVTRSATMPVLYGGSVNKENVHDFAKHPTIDGALVGAASLDPENFIAIIKEFHRESIHKV